MRNKQFERLPTIRLSYRLLAGLMIMGLYGCPETEDSPPDVLVCIPEDEPTVNVQVVDDKGVVVLNPVVEFRMDESVVDWTECRPGYAGGTVVRVPEEWCHCGLGVGRIELRVTSSEGEGYLEIENNETTAGGCQVVTQSVIISLD